jgi:hypothetical protein
MKNFKPILGYCLLAAALLSAGCASSGPPRSAVEGIVTVGGAPLPAGRIIFTPIAPTSGPAVSTRVAGGKYQFARSDGPVVGQNRVQVEADLNLGFALDDEEAFAKRGSLQLPQSPIPAEFGVSVEVKSGETNKHDVTVPAAIQTASY